MLLRRPSHFLSKKQASFFNKSLGFGSNRRLWTQIGNKWGGADRTEQSPLAFSDNVNTNSHYIHIIFTPIVATTSGLVLKRLLLVLSSLVNYTFTDRNASEKSTNDYDGNVAG
jgi:hypothetical protein